MVTLSYAAAGLIVLFLVLALVGAIRLRSIHLGVYGTPILILSLHGLDGEWETAGRLALSVIALIFGFYLARLKPQARRRTGSDGVDTSEKARLNNTKYVRVAPAVCVFTTILCVYHFSRVGVPIFANNVEAARFAYANSGLFGLPSRMYLYGTFLAVALAVGEARMSGAPVTKDRWVRFSFTVFLLSRAVSGFKSGLVDVALSTLLLAIFIGDGLVVRRYLGRIILAAAAAIGFVFLVGSAYASYSRDGRTLTGNIENRLTTQSAEPVWITMNAKQVDLGDSRHPIEMDISYFENRYAGVGAYDPYGFTRLVAARVAGESPTSTATITPVTLSLYAVAYYQFGFYLGMAFCFVVGLTLGLAEKVASGLRESARKFMVQCAVGEIVIALLPRGEIVYLVINWGLSVITLLLVAWIARLVLVSSPTKSNTLASNSGGPRDRGINQILVKG